MKLKGAIYCEGPDCNERARVTDRAMEAGRLPEGYVKLIRYGDDRDAEHGFCSRDCAMLWCATKPASETIDAGEIFGGDGV